MDKHGLNHFLTHQFVCFLFVFDLPIHRFNPCSNQILTRIRQAKYVVLWPKQNWTHYTLCPHQLTVFVSTMIGWIDQSGSKAIWYSSETEWITIFRSWITILAYLNAQTKLYRLCFISSFCFCTLCLALQSVAITEQKKTN